MKSNPEIAAKKAKKYSKETGIDFSKKEIQEVSQQPEDEMDLHFIKIIVKKVLKYILERKAIPSSFAADCDYKDKHIRLEVVGGRRLQNLAIGVDYRAIRFEEGLPQYKHSLRVISKESWRKSMISLHEKITKGVKDRTEGEFELETIFDIIQYAAEAGVNNWKEMAEVAYSPESSGDVHNPTVFSLVKEGVYLVPEL